ncbi:MAG: hypothetical protein MJ211_15835 [Bacteroidales bacterium]|nr:hypothetical protein [Bacteroidales bacterium]
MIYKELKFVGKIYQVAQLSSVRKYLRDDVKILLAKKIIKLFEDNDYPELLVIFTALGESLDNMKVSKNKNIKTKDETSDENVAIAKLSSFLAGIKEIINSKKRFDLTEKQKKQKQCAINLEKIIDGFSMSTGTKQQRLGKIERLKEILNEFAKADVEELELTEIVSRMFEIISYIGNTNQNKSDKKSDNRGLKPQASSILINDIRNFISNFNTTNQSLRGKYNKLAEKIEEYIKDANNSKRDDNSDKNNSK